MVRVALDLDGSLESLGNSMTDLADSLDRTGACELIRFRTQSARRGPNETRLALRVVWEPMWRRGLGRSIDGLLPPVDVVHVAGLSTPPTKRLPLIVSVDDLRPLRTESRTHQRITQLRRAVDHGAIVVASSRTASHEVLDVLAVERSRVVVVPPAVPIVEPTVDGADLVVNITGDAELFIARAHELINFARRHSTKVVALASTSVTQRLRAGALDVTALARRDARGALAKARVVIHFSDGARFPSFAIAALAAGVPTIALSTLINRELLDGSAALVTRDDDLIATLESVWGDDAHRAIMIAAGRSRAIDFAPATAARAYAKLYGDVARERAT